MPIKDLKFTEGDFTGQDVASLPDNPSAEGFSAAQLKARLDNVAKAMVALGKYNELIDALSSTAGDSGAKNIGTAAIADVTGENVQAVLESLKALDDANKEELLARIEQRVAKTDIVQMRGRSETQVMSQRAVTDAIDAGGSGGGGGEFEPVGCMKFFAGETLPDGYLWCDGQSYPANGVYKKLFDVIGTAYNQTDDAEGTFRVPDMRGRVGVGKNTGTFDALGKTGGEEAHTLSVNEIPSARLSAQGSVYYYGGTSGGAGVNAGTFGNNVSDGTPITTIGGGQPHNNVQPYLVCNYIVKFDRSYEEIGVTAPPCVWEIAAEEWQEAQDGGYVLNIPESGHRRGEHCVLTALYDTTEAGKLKAVLFEMEKNEAGDITIYSDSAFAGKAYIDRVYMVSAGRVLSVNGQGPDVDGDVSITEVDNAEKLDGQLPAYYATKAAVDDKIPLAKLSESASGNITAVSGNVYYGKWQKRNGWVRLSMYCTAATVANGGTWFQIVGAGLVGETKFTGTCVLSNGGMALALCSVSAGGTMKVENSSGSNMTGMVFDVTLPAQYP